MNIGKNDVAEAVGNVGSTPDGGDFHVSVVVADRKIAANVAGVDATERRCNDRRSSISQRDRTIAAGYGHRPLNVTRLDASEPIAHLQRALPVPHFHGTLLLPPR